MQATPYTIPLLLAVAVSPLRDESGRLEVERRPLDLPRAVWDAERAAPSTGRGGR